MKIRSTRKCFDGQLQFITHASSSTKSDMNFAIYLPPVPKHTVFFLSGLTCTDENFMTKSGALRVASELGTVLVAPDTSPRGRGIPDEEGASFYVGDMYDYVAHELPNFVAANFYASEKLGIMGHSMGGHGAMVIGLRESDRFHAISALAPIAAPTQCPWGRSAFSKLIGPDEAKWKAYDTCELIANGARKIPIRIDQGTADEFLHTQLMTDKLIDVAKKHDFPVEVMFRDGYDHSYYFVSTFIEHHLRQHSRVFLQSQ